MTKISSLSTFISTPGFQWHCLEQVFVSWHCLLNSLCSGVGFLWFCWQNRNHGVGLEFCLVWVFCFLFFFFSSRVCGRNISYFYNKISEDELSMQGLCLYEAIKWKHYTSRTIQWLVSGPRSAWGIWHFKKIKVSNSLNCCVFKGWKIWISCLKHRCLLPVQIHPLQHHSRRERSLKLCIYQSMWNFWILLCISNGTRHLCLAVGWTHSCNGIWDT